ncbi:MAG: hypothetical protein ACKPKO_51410 [Candidatus Fonsibacter sp.]
MMVVLGKLALITPFSLHLLNATSYKMACLEANRAQQQLWPSCPLAHAVHAGVATTSRNTVKNELMRSPTMLRSTQKKIQSWKFGVPCVTYNTLAALLLHC